MKRTKFEGPSNSLKHELERLVVSTNKVLKPAVSYMSVIELLRNVHPNWRSDYAYKLRDAAMIHPSEVSEFTAPVLRIPKYKWHG